MFFASALTYQNKTSFDQSQQQHLFYLTPQCFLSVFYNIMRHDGLKELRRNVSIFKGFLY